MKSNTIIPKDNLLAIFEFALFEEKGHDFNALSSVCKFWNETSTEYHQLRIQKKLFDNLMTSIKKQSIAKTPFSLLTFFQWINSDSNHFLNNLVEMANNSNPFAQFALFKIYGYQTFKEILKANDLLLSCYFSNATQDALKAYFYLTKAAEFLTPAHFLLEKLNKILFDNNLPSSFEEIKIRFHQNIKTLVSNVEELKELANTSTKPKVLSECRAPKKLGS